uniref:BTB domain-containing protein n=1 Tax=Anopheles farauti TaxID=69004 RepID=A0A182Q6T6_9DIPT
MKEPFEIMPDQEHYSLRWNNHQNHILRAFDTLLQTKTLVDVTLVCAETSIRAHKVVLSACSPFFQRVFSETPCKHPVIVLKDFRGWVVQAIVDFMYRGEISVPQERLSVLIQAGESLQVRGLVDHPVAANTPTPAQSPEDFSLLDSSLISPTSPSLPSPNFQTNHQADHLRHHPTAAASLITSSTPKLLLPPQVFADPAVSLSSANDPCTSPMPRRKQARPRRRSGDCAPQDLSSKPSSPVPPALDDEDAERELLDERPDDDDDLDELDDDDEDDLKRILHRSQSVDEKLAALGVKDDLRAQSSSSLAMAATSNSDERRSRSLHKLSPRKTSSAKGASVGLLKDDDHQPETTQPASSGSPMSDGPENLCMKKASPNSFESTRTSAGGIIGSGSSSEQRSRLASIDGAANSTTATTETNDRAASRDGTMVRLPDGSKNTSPLSDSISGSHMSSRGLLSLKDIRHLNRAALNRSLGSISPPPSFSSLNNNLHPALSLMHHHHHHLHHGESKRVKLEDREDERSLLHDDMMEPPHFLDHMDLALMFGLDSPLGLFPPGMDPGKIYSPLMEMSDPRGMHHDGPPFLKKKSPKPKHIKLVNQTYSTRDKINRFGEDK